MTCPHCNGDGFIVTNDDVPAPGGRDACYPSKQECICMFNRVCSKRYYMLDGVPGIVLDDMSNIKTLLQVHRKHIIFTGAITSFFLLVKTYLYCNDNSKVKHRVLFIDALRFHQQFAMPAIDQKENRYISDNLDYDVMAITFTGKRASPTYKETFAELIQSRSIHNKTTWVYIDTDDIKTSYEYSLSMDPFIKLYKQIPLDTMSFKNSKQKFSITKKISEQQQGLANI